MRLLLRHGIVSRLPVLRATNVTIPEVSAVCARDDDPRFFSITSFDLNNLASKPDPSVCGGLEHDGMLFKITRVLAYVAIPPNVVTMCTSESYLCLLR